MLERLVYRSKAKHQLGSLHLFNLLSACREKNQRLHITGHLLYTNEVFVQCIEGPPPGIESLWQSLQHDERHYDIELISRGPLAQRRFGDWSMAFSSYAHFNKFAMSGFFPVEADGMNEATLRCSAI